MRLAPLAVLLALTASSVARADQPELLDESHTTGYDAPADAAVVVGIEEYATMPGAPYASRDAQAFHDALVYSRGVPNAQVAMLTHGTTAKVFRSAVEAAASQVGDGGTLWVYFAGHGAVNTETGERILLGVGAHDAPGALESGQYSVELDEIDLIAASYHVPVVLVVDAGFSGTARDGKPLFEGKRFDVPPWEGSGHAQAIHWLATSADERAGTLESVRHGAFTYLAVGALRGWADGFEGEPDGTVTLAEAQAYVANALQSAGQVDTRPTVDAREDVAGMVLTSGELEAGPDVTEIGPKASKIGDAVAVTGGDDFLARLDELRREREERHAAEAAEAEVQAERNRKVSEAREALLAEARQAWDQLQGFLGEGGPEAVDAAEGYITAYESAAIEIEDETVAVPVPWVSDARDWLAEQRAVENFSDAVLGIEGSYVFVPPGDLRTALTDVIPSLAGEPASAYGQRMAAKARQRPDEPEYWVKLGRRAVARGDDETAGWLFAGALLIEPTGDGYADALRSLELGMDVERVVVGHELQRHFDDPGLHGAYGDALFELGDTEGACWHFGAARYHAPDAEQWRTRLVELCGDYLTEPIPGATTAGTDSLARMIRPLAPRDPGLIALLAASQDDPADDERWGDLADRLAEHGYGDVALEVYLQAYSLDVGDPEWRRKIVALGAAERMVPVARALSEAQPDADEPLGDYADALMAAGRTEEACEAYGRALAIDPQDSEWQRRTHECGSAVDVADVPELDVSSQEDILTGVRRRYMRQAAVAQQLGLVEADRGNDERWGDLGDALMAFDAELAGECYVTAMVIQPTDSEWRRKVGETRGLESVLAIYVQAVARGTTDDELIGDYGDALSDLGRSDEACAAYQEALSLDPDDSEWQRKVGSCGGTVAQGGEALQLIDAAELRGRIQSAYGYDATVDQQLQLVLADPGNDERWGDLGDVVRTYDESLASDCYLHALTLDADDGEWQRKVRETRGVDALLSVLTTLTSSGQADDELWGDYGDALAEVGRWEEACQAWSQAQSMDPDDGEWERKTASCGGVAGVEGADPLAQLGANPTDVSVQYMAAILSQRSRADIMAELAPQMSNDEVWGDAADALMSAGRVEEAVAGYRTAFELDPDDGEWLRKLALASHFDSGVEPQLLGSFEARLDRTNDESLGDYGDALSWVGRWDEACEAYRQALSIDADDSEWLRKVERCGTLAELQLRARRSDDANVHGALGYAAAASGDWRLAGRAWTEAARLAPTNSEWVFSAIAATGSSRVDLLEAARELHDGDDEFWGDLGDAYMDVGRLDDARQAYDRALDLDSDDSEWRRKTGWFRGTTP